MFESPEALVARLLAATPDQAPAEWEPILDPDGTLIDELRQTARATAMLEARQMQLLAAMCHWAKTWQDTHDPRRRDQVGPEDLVAAEVGPALRQTPATAAIRVDRANRIITRLPRTFELLARGELDLGRVLAIDDATRVLSDTDAAKVEELILGRAVDQTAGELRAALGKAVIRVDPAAAERRRQQAIKDRSVTKYTDRDGTSVLRAVLSAVDAGEMYDLIDQVARQTKTENDPRTMDQRRADALSILLLGRDPHLGPQDDDDGPAMPGPDDPTGPDQPDQPADGPDQPLPEPAEPIAEPVDEPVQQPVDGPDPSVDPDDPGPVEPTDLEHVPPDLADALINPEWRDRELTRLDKISELAALALTALARRRPPKLPWVAINTTTGPDRNTVHVGELQGYGPITAEYAEHLLMTGAARPPPTPTDREPTPAQAARHDPPEWLAEEVKARDGTCRFAGCRQPAHLIDLDHAIEHPHGSTVRGNLGGLCRRHHGLKTARHWRAVQHPDGVYEWTSNLSGRTYRTYPRGQSGDWRGTTNTG